MAKRLLSKRLNVLKGMFNKTSSSESSSSTPKSVSRVNTTEYGLKLFAKQLLKHIYGGIRERQFKRLFNIAVKQRGNTAENFAVILESRLDMAVFRIGMVPSISAARQLVTSGCVMVNGKKLDKPSYILKIGEVVSLNQKGQKIPVVTSSTSGRKSAEVSYYEFKGDFAGIMTSKPSIDEIPYNLDNSASVLQKIVEFYKP